MSFTLCTHNKGMAFRIDRFALKLLVVGIMLVAASVGASVLLTAELISQLQPDERTQAYIAAIGTPLIVAPIALSAMGVLAFRNHRLLMQVERLANHDDLTGLMNRRAFMTRANAQLAGNGGGGRAVLALADLDYFKRVNDTYGHAMGDIALRHVADQLKQSAPEGSLVARLGGEEFAILFEWTNLQDVQRVTERVCETIAASPCAVSESGTPVAITVSIGVAIAAAEENVDTLLRRADAAMYAAKHGGRNQTKLAA